VSNFAQTSPPSAHLVCSTIAVILAPGRVAAAPHPDAAATRPWMEVSDGSMLVSVAGVLVVAAATKGGYPLWAIGGMAFLYVLYLAVRCTNLSRVRPYRKSYPAGE
jgi:hypothetical protein